jgi:hypothetical protein
MKKNLPSKPRRRRITLLAIGTAALTSTMLITGVAGTPTIPAFAGQTHTTRVATESCTQSKAATEELRTMTTSQLEQVFESLSARPPIPNGIAAGYGWLDANASPITIQSLIHPIWQGKSIWTILGIPIVNDIFVGIQVPPGLVHYTTSSIDGRGALELDWTAYSPFYDEIRMFEPGVYVGFAFTDTNIVSPILDGFIPVLLSVLSGANITPDHPVEANVPYGNFLLDFDCPSTWWAS